MRSSLTDERVGADGKPKPPTRSSRQRLLEYVQHLMHAARTAIAAPIHLRKDEDPEGHLVCEVALQYHDGYNEQRC